MSAWFDRARFEALLEKMETVQSSGAVMRTSGLLIESRGPAAALGDFCEIITRSGQSIRTQVIGFRARQPVHHAVGGDARSAAGRHNRGAETGVAGGCFHGAPGAGDRWLWPSDGRRPSIAAEAMYDSHAAPPGPMEREPIRQPLSTGIRAIDGLLTCGRGQRIPASLAAAEWQEHTAGVATQESRCRCCRARPGGRTELRSAGLH